MDDSEKILDRLDAILAREQAEIFESKRLNHSSWDNHTITLSAVSIGFAFSFLPIASGDYVWLSMLSLMSLIAAILVSVINFSIAADGFDDRQKANAAQMLMFDRARRLIMRANNRVAVEGNNSARLAEIQAETTSEFEQIFNQFDPDAEVQKMNCTNAVITRFNKCRGWLFLVGLTGLTVFGILNIENVVLNVGR